MTYFEDDYTEEEYLQLILATYTDIFPNEPGLAVDLIRADLHDFEVAEQYEACARLKKILDKLE
jgi:hypothetical protein